MNTFLLNIWQKLIRMQEKYETKSLDAEVLEGMNKPSIQLNLVSWSSDYYKISENFIKGLCRMREWLRNS